MTWPAINTYEQQWNDSLGHSPVRPSGFRQQPMDPAFAPAPAPYLQAPPPGLFQGPAPLFAQTQATDGYPRSHFACSHASTNEDRHSLPADFSQRSSAGFFEAPRAFVPNINDFGADGRHRRRQPPRRPAHWEDDLYPASSSLRDSIIQAALALNSHQCFPGIHHPFGHPPCLHSCCTNDCQPQLPDQTLHGHGHRCTHRNRLPSCRCGVTHSTLTHVGPSSGNHLPCAHCGPTNAQPTTSGPSRPQDEPGAQQQNQEPKKSNDQRGCEGGRGVGRVGRWLMKHFRRSAPFI